MKKFFNSKAFKIIKSIFNVAIAIFIVLFLLIVCLQRFSDNKLSFFNFRMFTVITGSMEPLYNVGDVLVAKEVEPEDVEVGDTISYLGAQGQFKDKVITHEVISIEKNEKGEILYHTKGLANIVEDPIVNESQLYGVVVYKAAILSLIYKIIATKIGMFIFVVVPVIYIIVSEVVGMMLEKEEERRSKKKKKED